MTPSACLMPSYCTLGPPVVACALTHVGTGPSISSQCHGSPPSGKLCRDFGPMTSRRWQLAASPIHGVLQLHNVWQLAPSGTLTDDQPAWQSVRRALQTKWLSGSLCYGRHPPTSHLWCQRGSCAPCVPLMLLSMDSTGLCHGRQSLDRLPLLATAGMCAFCPVPSARWKTGLGSSSRTAAT